MSFAQTLEADAIDFVKTRLTQAPTPVGPLVSAALAFADAPSISAGLALVSAIEAAIADAEGSGVQKALSAGTVAPVAPQ